MLPEYILLASSSGTAAYESGKRIYLVKKRAQWTTVALFVVGLLSFLTLVNGGLQIFFFSLSEGGHKTLGLILIGAGLFFLLLFVLIFRYRKAANAVPVKVLKCICIFDFDRNEVLDPDEKEIVKMNEAGLDRKFQMRSSSPALVLKWEGGTLELVSGNPFSGGIAAVEDLLTGRGIRQWKK